MYMGLVFQALCIFIQAFTTNLTMLNDLVVTGCNKNFSPHFCPRYHTHLYN